MKSTRPKPKVLFVGNLPNPVGGVATHCRELTQAMAGQVDIIFCDTHRHREKTRVSGMQYAIIAWHSPLTLLTTPQVVILLLRDFLFYGKTLGKKQSLRYIKTVLTLLVMLRKNKDFDLVHSQHCNVASLAASVIARAHSKPLVVTAHGAEFSYEPIWIKIANIIKAVCQRAETVIAVSENTKSWIRKRGIETVVDVIYNGVNFDKFGSVTKQQRRGHQNQQRTLLFVGQVASRKGPDVLIDAVAQIKKDCVKALIVGQADSTYSNRLRDQIKTLKLEERVELLGEVSEKRLLQLYHEADVFVFPTKLETEGFGLVVAEAMAAGLPVIASRIGPLPEIISHGDNGLLFEPDNAGELARAIERLLTDRNLYDKISGAGRETARSSFSWQKAAQQTIQTYNKIIGKN